MSMLCAMCSCELSEPDVFCSECYEMLEFCDKHLEDVNADTEKTEGTVEVRS